MEISELKEHVGKKAQAWFDIRSQGKPMFDGEVHGRLAIEGGDYHVVCEGGYCWIRIVAFESIGWLPDGTLVIHLKA